MAPRHRIVLALMGAAIAVSVTLTGLAFTLSYAHLQHIAHGNGLDAEQLSWMWPAIVDLFIVVGEIMAFLAWLARTSLRPGLCVTGGGALASVAINVAGVGAHRPGMEYVVAAAPPVASVVAFGLIMAQLRTVLASLRTNTDDNTHTDPEPEQDEPEQPPVHLPPAPTHTPAHPPTLVTRAEVAQRFGVTTNAVANWGPRHGLTPVLVVPGKGAMYDSTHVDAFATARNLP